MTADKNFLYRYPGTKPFEFNEHELFKGRDEDIKNLYELISLQSLIVLFGRSGLGKSSLLNAGLVNSFKNDPDVVPVFLRFGVYHDKNTITPLEKLRSVISEKQQANSSNFIFEKLIPKEEITVHRLWYFFKSFQITNRDKQKFTLIFDQFEELFTYPENDINLFKKELSELLYIGVPQQLRNLLKDKLLLDPGYLTKEERDLLFSPLNTRILFSIRSDKLSLLNGLKDYFPSVLKLCYELKALNKQQARQAIEEPAKLDDKNYISPPFTFTEEALTLILNSLTKISSKKEDNVADHKQEIETFQLQIVCKYAENLVVEKQLKQISASDLDNIKGIFENHYRNIIAKLSPDRQLPARRLIEEKLIIDGSRVSMPVPFILRDKGMTEELLDQLISTHILRPEQNNTVEISHDTLIEPILKYYDERKKQEAIELELQEKEAQIKRIKEEQKIKAKRNRLIITIVSIGLAITLGFAGYAIIQSREARKQKEFAIQESQKAEKQKDTADYNAWVAKQEQKKADSSALEAQKQRVIAENNAEAASKQQEKALENAKRSIEIGKRRLVMVTLLLNPEGTDFATLTTNKQDGLSFGLQLWNQRDGSLNKILQAFQKENPGLFVQIFADGDSSLAKELINYTSKRFEGLKGDSSDPVFNLTEEPWLGRFKKAGQNPALQAVQLKVFTDNYLKFMEELKLFAPQIKSERGVAFMLDLAYQIGISSVKRSFGQIQKSDPNLSESEILLKMQKVTTESRSKQYQSNLNRRRQMFITTPYLSDSPIGLE